MLRHYYTVYGKDDIVIASGTATECSKQLQITVPSFFTMVSKLNKGKKYHRYTAVLIDKEDIDENDTDK